jgi:hypothetical protein
MPIKLIGLHGQVRMWDNFLVRMVIKPAGSNFAPMGADA